MDFQHILVSDPHPYVRCITLNRPKAANALNTRLAVELTDALHHAKAEAALRGLILTGAGTRVFCAGADLKERAGMDKTAWDTQHHAFEEAFAALGRLEIPTIAAVNGAAIAGGFELALACDLIVASPHATFAFKEATLGIMPGLGGTARLPRAIGARRALEMLLTADEMDAKIAAEIGLVNQVSTEDDVLKTALTLAEKIAANAPLSIKAIKKSVREGAALPLDEALTLELAHYATLIETRDRTEGINAFNEKRKPEFKGA